MDATSIKGKIKAIIANVIARDPGEIPDRANFVDDLQLESLDLLEIAVDVDYEFKLGMPEERLLAMGSVDDYTELVVDALEAKGRD